MLVAVIAGLSLVLSGCTSPPVKEAASQASPTPKEPPELTITPNAEADKVPISAEIGTKVSNGKVTSVVLTDDKGKTVEGALREDGTSWVPKTSLEHRRSYTAEVTATNDSGMTTTQRTNFTTMAKPGRQTTTTLHFEDNRTYGVAMPITVRFETPVPKEARASAERRLFVQTDPPQRGVWHWVKEGTQAFYRAPDYWQPGTTITVRSALGGHPLGGGNYGDTDRTATAKIGGKVTVDVDSATKRLSVYENDKLVKNMPVSLGKPSTPTSTGTMVIMEKAESTIFDTFAELGPAEGYRVAVDHAQRLTWGGEFIHSAPWSVGDQGRRNVSHGCLNLSPANARWLFGITKIGDPVTVRNTEVGLTPGNGWTAWDLSWEEYVKGSALPIPPDLEPTGNPSAAANGSPPANGAPSTGPSKSVR